VVDNPLQPIRTVQNEHPSDRLDKNPTRLRLLSKSPLNFEEMRVTRYPDNEYKYRPIMRWMSFGRPNPWGVAGLAADYTQLWDPAVLGGSRPARAAARPAGAYNLPRGRVRHTSPATSSTRISNPRFLSYMASYDVASNVDLLSLKK